MSKWSGLVLLVLLASCGSEQPVSPDKTQQPLEKALDTQLDALEKAKSLEESLQQQKLERDRRISEQDA